MPVRSPSPAARSLRPLAVASGYELFDTTPTTFLLGGGLEQAEILPFKRRCNEIQKGNFAEEKLPPKHCKNNM